jgi:PAS domain S-box-containing protein
MAENPNYEKLKQKLKKLEKNGSKEKQAHKMLKQKITELDSFINNIPDMAWIKDANSRFVVVNRAFGESVGMDQESLIHQTCEICFGKEGAKKFREDDLKVMKGRRQKTIEEKIIDSQNNRVWLETVKSPIINHSGKAIGTVGISRNISKRKRAEEKLRKAHDDLERIVKERTAELKQANEQLRKSGERYALATSAAKVGVWDWNIKTGDFYLDPNIKAILGYSDDEIPNDIEIWVKYVHPEDSKAVMEAAQACLDGKTSEYIFEHRMLHKDDSIRWILVRGKAIRDESGNAVRFIGTDADITERKRAEEALRESDEKLARSNKIKSLGLLAGGVAHDLNNVLSGIVSYPDLLLLQLPEDSPYREFIETIKESGARAVAIVHDLLTVASGVATTKDPLNLNNLISDYLHSPEFNKLKQFHPTVAVNTNLDTDLLNISGSHVHIRKVVMNLVSNASEAIKGSGNVTISTLNRYLDKPLRGYDDINEGEYAVLTVSDDGSGISSDDLGRIFEPFYTKKVMGRSGTGLGLTVVWNTVQDNKGYIDVTSGEIGTTFELYFPITRDEILGKDMFIPTKDYKGNGETILVVDDVESQRQISCKLLDTLGYKTKAVSSGEEAVEYLKENNSDLILLDMIMDPGINGRETYEKIIEIHPNQKAIIISGFAETDEVKEAQKLGVGKYIKKPFTFEKIGIAVKEELKK